MSKPKKKKIKAIPLVEWLRIVELLVAEHSSKRAHVLIKKGKYKGYHKTTRTLAWVYELARMVHNYITLRNKGRTYDGNMAVASLLGLILCTWYAQLQRAKGMDPNRPLSRKVVFTRLTQWRELLFSSVTDERIMVKVWDGQQWNLPFGNGAVGGGYV